MTSVLLVDDDYFMRKSLRTVLEDHGFTVVGEGINGLEAFELFQSLEPDTVLMDVCMPQYSGFDGLDMIMEHNSSARVLMMSGLGTPQVINKAMQKGAQGLLIKPITVKNLLDALYACV